MEAWYFTTFPLWAKPVVVPANIPENSAKPISCLFITMPVSNRGRKSANPTRAYPLLEHWRRGASCLGIVSERDPYAELQLPCRRDNIAGFAEGRPRSLQGSASWRAYRTAGVQCPVVGFCIEVRMVRHVEHIYRGTDLDSLPDLEGPR